MAVNTPYMINYKPNLEIYFISQKNVGPTTLISCGSVSLTSTKIKSNYQHCILEDNEEPIKKSGNPSAQAINALTYLQQFNNSASIEKDIVAALNWLKSQ